MAEENETKPKEMENPRKQNEKREIEEEKAKASEEAEAKSSVQMETKNKPNKKRKPKKKGSSLDLHRKETMAVDNETKPKEMEKPGKQKEKRGLKEEAAKASEEAEAKSSVQTEVKNKPNKKRKQDFPFGNYKGYYGYRIGPGREVEEDPRIKVLKKEWFEGKDCLDIGCNSGIITIQIAKKYNCRSILGVDIDSVLIEDAFRYLRKLMKLESAQKKQAMDSSVKVVHGVNSSEHCTDALSNEGVDKCPNHHSSGERDLSDIVSFRQENFVQSHCRPYKYYDTILCLSVTKWIHLNWGDDGLITLFSKIWRLLHPGGVFVFEPQPWKSYENNRRASETTASNYRNIMFRPKHFREILLDKIGFRKVEDLTSGLSGTRTGFDRQIFAFYK